MSEYYDLLVLNILTTFSGYQTHNMRIGIFESNRSVLSGSAGNRVSSATYQTIDLSVQLRTLEDTTEEPLFERVNRGLILTEVGKTTYRYTDEIFRLGHDFINTFQGRESDNPIRLVVGIAEVVPNNGGL
ncbi:MAG: hypothetical protein NPIRA02_25070 [Nitrospirales bacterium]|nr:MAG: hypothetical protein NPIRA02_25070 [Nitrospirales bacterium]